MVDDAAATLAAIVANGGEITQAIGADAPEITARFRDPGGNIIGLYQQPAQRPRRERACSRTCRDVQNHGATETQS